MHLQMVYLSRLPTYQVLRHHIIHDSRPVIMRSKFSFSHNWPANVQHSCICGFSINSYCIICTIAKAFLSVDSVLEGPTLITVTVAPNVSLITIALVNPNSSYGLMTYVMPCYRILFIICEINF